VLYNRVKLNLLTSNPVLLLLLQNGNTPLHFSAEKGCKEEVGWLLAAGAAVNATNEVSHPPNMSATRWQLHAVDVMCRDVASRLSLHDQLGAECMALSLVRPG
jgi:ankyrin repeat protein